MNAQEPNKTQTELVNGFNSLGLELMWQLEDGKNCFMSPLSIGLALSMLALGGRRRTLAELERLLAVSVKQDEGDNGFQRSFIATVSVASPGAEEPDHEYQPHHAVFG